MNVKSTLIYPTHHSFPHNSPHSGERYPQQTMPMSHRDYRSGITMNLGPCSEHLEVTSPLVSLSPGLSVPRRQYLPPPVNRPCVPLMRVKHPPRRAFVAGLVRIVSFQPFFLVCARPAPCVRRALQREPQAIESRHELQAAGPMSTRRDSQELSADAGADPDVDGKDVGGCHS